MPKATTDTVDSVEAPDEETAKHKSTAGATKRKTAAGKTKRKSTAKTTKPAGRSKKQ